MYTPEILCDPCGLKISLKLINLRHMKNIYKITSITMESGKYTMSDNKAIIETYLSTGRYYNCTNQIIEKNTTIFKI